MSPAKAGEPGIHAFACCHTARRGWPAMTMKARRRPVPTCLWFAVAPASCYRTQDARALWRRRSDPPSVEWDLELSGSSMLTNTLNAVRQRLAAEEPELRRRGV